MINTGEAKNRGKQGRKSKTEQFAPPHFRNCWAHLDNFPKFISCVIYLVSKLGKSGVHSFKRCLIWSWNEEVMPFEDDCAKLNGNVAAAPILLLLDTFLEHFLELKLCIPYVFLKLRKSGVQCFKTVCNLDLKRRSYGHLKESNFAFGRVNSVLCEIFAQHPPLCEIFAQHLPCANFWASSSLPSPIPSLWASFLCSIMPKTRGGYASAP